MATVATRCCIAGGGPAGLMAGLLLVRAGVEVIVLEKHADFLRDFRGDTIHPSTLELMHELGLIEDFLALPHQKVEELAAEIGDEVVTIADFRHLLCRSRFIALMPQWEFLSFLAGHAGRLPGFRLLMETQAVGLIERGDRIAGVRAVGPQGAFEIEAPLTIAADGRRSLLRDLAGLPVTTLGAAMDVLWLRLPRRLDEPEQALGRFDAGAIMVRLNRGDYWQCACVIAKGGYDGIRAAGLPAFRARLARLAPVMADRLEAIASWDEVKLLSVSVDRLERWHRPGLLCIGDAAHAMSPIGGIGINLAIQDAVAAANLLHGPLRAGRLEDRHLHAVQRRREWPTKATQWLQVQAQNRIIGPTLESSRKPAMPMALRLFQRWPLFRRLPARFVGMGLRPEHIEAPAVHAIGPN